MQTGAVIVGGFPHGRLGGSLRLRARLVELAKNMLRPATTTLTPAVSEREATGDFDGVRRVLLDGTRWALYLVLPIHLGLLVFGKPFFARWVGGPQYAEWCFPTMAVLSATLTIGVAQSVASRILYGMGKLKLFARLALVEAAVNLALSLVLVETFGIVGIAVAVAVPNVLFCLFVITYACRTLNVESAKVPAGKLAEAARRGVCSCDGVACARAGRSELVEHFARRAGGVGALRADCWTCGMGRANSAVQQSHTSFD